MNEGNFTFGDHCTSKIIGKGTLNLNNGRAKVEYVLYVEELKHNLLSLSQMCDRGHTLTSNFNNLRSERQNMVNKLPK